MAVAVEVMLMADVKKLGKAGAIVKVAPGYARNMLLPQGLAAPVTEASKRRLAKLEAKRAEERAARKAAAEALATKLAGLQFTVKVRTVDGTRLYGSVNPAEILSAIETARGVKLERGQLLLPEHLREIGSYTPKIDLGEGVQVPFKFQVVEDTAE